MAKTIVIFWLVLLTGLTGKAWGVEFTAQGKMTGANYFGQPPVKRETEQIFFSVAVKDDLFLITVTNAAGKQSCAIGNDGEHIYTWSEFSGDINIVHIGSGPDGCSDTGRILWAAFVSQKYWDHNERHNTIPLESYSINHVDSQTEIQAGPVEYLPDSRLPAKLQFFGPNYQVDVNNAKHMFGPPYDKGYLSLQYLVNQTKSISGTTVPERFEFTGFLPASNPKARDDVQLFWERQFQVTNFEATVSVRKFLPTLQGPNVLVQEEGIKYMATEHVYKGRDKKWKVNGEHRLDKAMLAMAEEATFTTADVLQVGDPAPKLQPGKFVQGDPVTEFVPGKAYLVEFWGIACPPCLASIPHINDIHTRFKDKGLIVIGQNCSEPESKVAGFVKLKGQSMTYRVASDNTDGKMSQTWQHAAMHEEVPVAFLIDTSGKIAWIGHPMELNDRMIEDVLAGKFNAEASATADEKVESKKDAIVQKLQAAVEAKDWETASAQLEELAKLKLPSISEEMLNDGRLLILFGRKNDRDAYKLIRQMGDARKDDPLAVIQLARIIVTEKMIEHPDLDLAEELARRAANGIKEEAWKTGVYDTMARIKFMRGKKEEAIVLEQKAIAQAGDQEKERFQKSLDSYKKGILPEVE